MSSLERSEEEEAAGVTASVEGVDDEASKSEGDEGSRPPLHAKKLSDLLTEIAGDRSREWISVSDLILLLRDRAFAALLVIFAIPNVLPTPPGTSYILGAPLLFLTLQLMIGARAPWLPGVIRHRSISRASFEALAIRASPKLARIERLLRPRLLVLTGWSAERVIGTICFILAVILFLPIPLGNMMPALAICLFALAMLERDGVLVLIGLLTTVLAIGILVALFYAGVNIFEVVWEWLKVTFGWG